MRLGLLGIAVGAIVGVLPADAHAAAHRVVSLREPKPAAYASAKASAEHRYRAWLERHPSATSSPAPRAGVFEGFNDLGLAGNGPFTSATPPDPTGAIGPGDYVEMVNSEIAVYSRSKPTAPAASEGEDEFTGGTSTCDGQIRWDQQARRWEYASLDCGEKPGYSFGWSKNDDPADLAGGWCKYHVETGSILYDYPKLGGDDEYLILGANKFDLAKGEEYAGSTLLVIAKPLPGVETCTPQAAVAATISEIEVPVFTPVPANVFGSSTTGYVVAADYPEPTPGKDLRLFTITKGPTGPVVSEQGSPISVSSYTFPAPVPQPGTADTLDSSDTRITQAVAVEDPSLHKEAIWTQHTVSTSAGQPSVVRWYELSPGAAAPVQAGTIEAGGGNFAFNAAISPTSSGDRAVIHYNVAGPTLLVQLQARSRTAEAPPGAMAGEVTLATSAADDDDFSCPSVTKEGAPCRWGDYAGASPDPANSEVVWGSGQFDGPTSLSEPHAPQWRTENFALSAATSPAPAEPPTEPTPPPPAPAPLTGGESPAPGPAPSVTTAPASAPLAQPAPAVAASNEVKVIEIKRHRKTASLTLTLLMPGPGRVEIRDANGGRLLSRRPHRRRAKALIGTVRVLAERSGKMTVRIALTAAGRRALAHRHRLAVELSIRFTPPGSKTGVLMKRVTFRR